MKNSNFFIAVILLFSISGQAFEKKTIFIGSKKLIVEVAETEAEMEQGLMYRKSLADGYGMLFIFDSERILSFWMKNTLIPLTIGFFDSNKKLLETIDMEPASPMDMTPKVYESSKPAKYAVEVPQGWFKKSKIKNGDKLKIETGLKSK